MLRRQKEPPCTLPGLGWKSATDTEMFELGLSETVEYEQVDKGWGERSFLVEITAEAERHELVHHAWRMGCRRHEAGWLEAKPHVQTEPKIFVMVF